MCKPTYLIFKEYLLDTLSHWKLQLNALVNDLFICRGILRDVSQSAGVQLVAIVLQELLTAVQRSRAGLCQAEPERR